MSGVFATWKTAVEVVVAALVPTTTSGCATTYTLARGDDALGDEPEISDRTFEVRSGDGGSPGSMFGEAYRHVTRPFTVSVRYDGRNAQSALDARMIEDEEQIVSALEKAANRSAGVHVVTWTGSKYDRTGGEFQIAHHEFSVMYRVAL